MMDRMVKQQDLVRWEAGVLGSFDGCRGCFKPPGSEHRRRCQALVLTTWEEMRDAIYEQFRIPQIVAWIDKQIRRGSK